MPMVSLLIIVSRTAVSVVSGATASASLRDRYCSFAWIASAKNNFKRVIMVMMIDGRLGIIRTHLCSRGGFGRHRGTASQKWKSQGFARMIGQKWRMGW